MKKIFLLLLISLTLFSCKTADDIASVEISASSDVLIQTEPSENNPVITEEVQIVEPPVEVVTEDAVSEEVVEEPVVIDAPAESPIVQQESRPKDIVEEISERIEGAYSEEIVSTEDPVMVNEAEEIVESPQEPVVPAEEINVPINNYPSQSVLDLYISEDILFLFYELIAIVVIFTLSSVIRNKFDRPLPLSIAIVLTILFVAIPITVSMIISGWKTVLLLYLSLFLCLAVFRSKDKRI